MRVVVLAKSTLTYESQGLFEELGYQEDTLRSLDSLPEFAGRNCYQSFQKPNPERQTNRAYLKHILDVGHESVLEHSSVTFFVEGISRNLLLELERHRHLSFSVLSTRYVDADQMGFVVHPGTPRKHVEAIGTNHFHAAELAQSIYDDCRDNGMSVKQAREIARQVLPGNTETKIVVTGNLRAWRYVINLRNHPDADLEIQLFAKELLSNLKLFAPNSFQDMEI